MKITSAVPTSLMDSFAASPDAIKKPKAVFVRAILPNQKEDNSVSENCEEEVKQGLGRVVAKISGYRGHPQKQSQKQSQKQKQIENYRKLMLLEDPDGQKVGQKLDKCA